MAVYAYLRVSTDQQDVDNQRYGVLVYANARGLGPLQFVEDTASGRLAWRERAVGRLLTETTQAGDVVLFAEVSRMARSTLQVLEMLACCMQRGVHVHIAKQYMVLDGSLPSRITATVLGLAAEIEREFIAMRTAGGAREAAGGGQAPGASQRQTRGTAQTRCAGGPYPRVPGQGHQHARDRETDRRRAVDALCVVDPAQPPPCPRRGTRPGPLGNAVRRLVSSGEEQGE